ncbi:MAG: 3-dehydroquinate synthase [Candidatus Marinimicrobia bacterium]|nr:3-dehydroquinate synthase [Candidatus Neomarinimicrobiota bacterium]
MKHLTLKTTNGSFEILIAESLKNIRDYLPEKRAIILTDRHVASLYRGQFPDLPVIEIESGETNKNLETVNDVYRKLIDLEADRSTFLLGIGGGIVTDVTGFIGSTFLRGIDYGFVASTVLAQVDAAIGGKNGVNYSGYKNLIGTIRQPRFVICDLEMLRTLPTEEVRSGFAEIVKTAAVRDASLFAFLEDNIEKAVSLDLKVMEKIIAECVRIKTEIVSQDEKESGQRRLLNFGHSFGHAIEKVSGLTHGESVSIGMCLSVDFSVKRNILTPESSARLKNLLTKINLPTRILFQKEAIVQAMRKDKKRENENLHFVFLHDIGDARTELISLSELKEFLDDLC